MERIWRILAIDGGGIRGIIPATILASIEERTGKPISQMFDLIAGTSTGGILALGLTKPDASGKPEYTAQMLCDLYKQNIPRIFSNPQSWWGNLITPKYRSFAFQEVLKEAFASYRLKNCLTDVLIPCYDIEHRMPYMFRSRLAKLENAHDFPMRDVALAASASPTMFHPVNFSRSVDQNRSICLVDGGVFANNPTISAMAESREMNPEDNQQFLIVSLGTGKSKRPLTNDLISLWGYVHWSEPMLELVMESGSESVHQQMIQLLPSSNVQQYYRLQIDLPKDSNHAIDDASASNMTAIINACTYYCSDKHSGQTLNSLCEKLVSLSEQQEVRSSTT